MDSRLKPSYLKNLKDKLNITKNKLTQSRKKPKLFTTVKSQIPLKEHYNYMSDLLFLPTSKKGFKYLLVCVDLANDEFDIQPIKNKLPNTILKAFEIMFTRPYIKKPYSSIRTDNGTEFKGVFQKWCYNNSIYHSTNTPNRHTQLSNVESLNRILGRLFNGYMNSIEIETGKPYREWTDVVDTIRVDLNIFRKKGLPKNINDVPPQLPNTSIKPKFKVGDIVHIMLDTPQNALGETLKGNFREADLRFSLNTYKITDVVPFSGLIPYRYKVNSIKNTTFTAEQLLLSKAKTETYKIKKIIGDKIIAGKEYYLIWWKGYKKKEATWELKTNLVSGI